MRLKNMDKNELLPKLRHRLIVSCQALEHEPLHSPYIMSRMAVAAELGGAAAIRANSGADVAAIKQSVSLPVIGLKKRVCTDSEVYITPALPDVDELVSAGADAVALDATKRVRPGDLSLTEFYSQIRSKYPDLPLMADISDYEEGETALKLGFDLISTTLCGYTPYTKEKPLPNFELVQQLSKLPGIALVAEGGIWEPADLRRMFELGAYAAVVGTAITRPMEITKRFVKAVILDG